MVYCKWLRDSINRNITSVNYYNLMDKMKVALLKEMKELLSLEEYIAKRKKEDRLNEFDLKNIRENIRVCVNYVFEYYNNYIPIDKIEEKTILKEEKLDRYRKQLDEYDPEIVDWLVSLNSEYSKHMNRIIGNAIDDDFFLLYDKEEEFRSVSYSCYSKLIKRCPFLKDQTEMLYKFIKEYHRILSMQKIPYICDEINEWLEQTLTKYHVNLSVFAYDWANYFYENEDIWPPTCRHKSQYSFRKYDYDIKQKSNLFNLDSLYRRMPKKPYTRGRKQELEILMMYHWLHSLEGDDDGYWQEYLEKVLPGIIKNSNE